MPKQGLPSVPGVFLRLKFHIRRARPGYSVCEYLTDARPHRAPPGLRKIQVQGEWHVDCKEDYGPYGLYQRFAVRERDVRHIPAASGLEVGTHKEPFQRGLRARKALHYRQAKERVRRPGGGRIQARQAGRDKTQARRARRGEAPLVRLGFAGAFGREAPAVRGVQAFGVGGSRNAG